VVNFKLSLEQCILSYSNNASLFPSLRSRWDALDCWQLPPYSPMSPSDATSSPVIDFTWMVRGFVPLTLSRFLSLFFNKKDLSLLLNCAIYDMHVSFRSDVWIPRCLAVKEIEPRYLELTRVPADDDFSSSSSVVADSFCLLSSRSWIGWLGRMLSSGSSHLTEGFRLRANISF
jgi:hypothetical protein